MSFAVQCPSCFRAEIWEDPSGASRAVTTEGGARQPVAPPPRASGEAALKVWSTGRRVVGPCPACGLWLAGPVELLEHEVVVALPDGPVTLRGGVAQDAQGTEVALAEVSRRLVAAYPIPREPLLPQIARSVFVMWLLGVFVIWLFTASVFVSFLANIGAGVPEAVRGDPGFDGTYRPAEPAAP